MIDFADGRRKMVDTQIRPAGITEPNLMSATAMVVGLEEDAALARTDRPGARRVGLQPSY
jgi:hypothetical protein